MGAQGLNAEQHIALRPGEWSHSPGRWRFRRAPLVRHFPVRLTAPARWVKWRRGNDSFTPTARPGRRPADRQPPRCRMITPSPDLGRADFRVILWVFVWLAVGGVVWAAAVAHGSGDFSAVFADAPR